MIARTGESVDVRMHVQKLLAKLNVIERDGNIE